MKCDVHGVDGCTSRGCAIWLEKAEKIEKDKSELRSMLRGPTLRRHPGDFDGYPTDEQMGYFKRGGR